MLRSMSGKQFREWRAFAELEPFAEVRADLRSAQVVQTIRGLFEKGVTLQDCLLPFPEEDETEEPKEAPAPTVRDWREIKAIGQQWVDALANRDPTTAPEATH